MLGHAGEPEKSQKCLCVQTHLGQIIPRDLIRLIEGYVHISDYIYDKLVESLNGFDIYEEYEYTQKIPKKFEFSADSDNNSEFKIGDYSKNSSDIDIEITMNLSLCPDQIELFDEDYDNKYSPDDENVDIIARINGQIIMFPRESWGGIDLTPFSKFSVDQNNNLMCYEYRGKRNPSRVLFKAAHSALWVWFHGGS